MSTSKFIVDLGRIGRTNDHEKSIEIDSDYLDLWKKISLSLTSKRYSHKGVSSSVTADWSPVIDFFQHKIKQRIEYDDLIRKNFNDAAKVFLTPKKDPVVTFTVSIIGQNNLSDTHWYPRFFVERYLYDIFLVANLTIPGSCEFLNLRFIEDNGAHSDRFLLSSYNFEEALYDNLDNIQPSPYVLPFDLVLKWHENLNLGIKQKAENPIEKAIFSLLHICSSEVEPISIIWVFHALESLYSTRVGEGFTNLINRISILLELDEKEKSAAKKKLRLMYDYRSSIVHGGFQVHHPLSNEAFDKRLDDDYHRVYELFQFGFNIIVASLQIMITKNWQGLIIKESLVGIVQETPYQA